MLSVSSMIFAQSRWWGIPGAIAVIGSPLLSGLSHVLGIWELFFGGWMLLLFGTLFSAALMTTGNAVPRWATPLLILGSLVLLGFNGEDNRAYLAFPFGAAAIVLGLALILDEKLKPSA